MHRGHRLAELDEPFATARKVDAPRAATHAEGEAELGLNAPQREAVALDGRDRDAGDSDAAGRQIPPHLPDNKPAAPYLPLSQLSKNSRQPAGKPRSIVVQRPVDRPQPVWAVQVALHLGRHPGTQHRVVDASRPPHVAEQTTL
eukprot:scaffold12262_cov121-Isochrysis_galbana.AAC.1